jgi:Sec-independent protein translocase protein TatA
MQAQGHQKLDAQEIRSRELADDWMRVYKQFQEAISGIEEEMCYEEAQDIKQEANRTGLTERVNEILRDRQFDGELIT